ncbi:unnamed protein product [Lymnaea stagnalis]|uniref:DH domain-containing protein n=1 Tax=Lymnaea stagnalis TaxID=6523 RepID=A0AAV2IN36_LYMST
MKEQGPTAVPEVVKRRSLRSSANHLNRRSWPLAPGSFKQQLKDRERQDQLTEILNRYSANGLPALPDLLNILRPQFKEEIFTMELSWHLLVDGDENLTKKQQEHQEAVWELLHTEVSYIKQIRVIIDVFQNCLINVQNDGFLNDIETERLFSNIDKIYECNCNFWQQFLLPVLATSRENHKPLDPLICKGGFVEHFQQKFEVYFKYFIEHKSCLDYAKSCMENNDLFKTFITWAETQKQCNRLKMADLMVKPMQRLLKYSLLLQAILRHTENESERADIKEMIQSVEKLCWAANNSLQRRDEYEKLDAVRKTIEPYDAIEAPTDECTKIIQEYSSNFSLLAPVPGFRDGQPRSLLFQSSLRMKEAQNTKLDVDCLLFTDLILICKSNRKMDKFKIIRPPMRLDQLVVRELKDKGSFLLIYMNECQVPISAFAFHSDTGAIRGWLEKFREAQKDFKNRKIQESSPPDRRGTAVAIQEEGEFPPLTSVPSDLNINSFPRSDSMESADHFMPNLLTPGDFTSDSLELGRSGSTGDIQNGPMSGHKAMTHTNTDPKMVLNLDPSPSDPQWLGGSVSVGNNATLSTKHKPVQTSRSVPNITVNINQSPTNSLPQSSNDNGYRGLNESTADGNTGSTPNQGSDAFSASQVSHSDQHSVFSEDESSKQKSNTRRVSRTEKRYHTADAIQDMKFSEKDTSIHKRLSWRIDVDQTKNLGSKVSSTDSSSWVSSTGSLPSNPESDISKEIESGFSSSSDHHRQKIFLLGGPEELGNEADSDMTDLESSQTMSKSTPDLVTMFSSTLHVSELKDGIASVAVDGFNRKLTRDDIRKMKLLKHQVLYDANIESSEV